jgi:bifunctional non-homologous end joining protein LigD
MAKAPRKTSKPLLQDDKPLRGAVRKPRDPHQPRLPFDPMPARIDPCLAALAAKPPKGDQWSFEVKWDGYRLAVHIEPTGVHILTRGGHDWTDRFPAIARSARAIGGTAIIDGEAVVLDEQGRPDFGALQQALGGRGGKRSADFAVLYAFDLLYFDGHDLRNMELHERRELLAAVIKAGDEAIRLSEDVDADGDLLLAAACEHGLEGIIAKRKDRPYRSGRLGDWLKIKCIQSDSFFIVGYEPSSAGFGGVGRLLLAARKGDDLVYVGGVGTGLNERSAAELRDMMSRLIIKKPSIGIKRSGAVFIQPTLIAEIKYRGWTNDGKLRHSSYKGLREAQDNAAVLDVDSIEDFRKK